MWPIAAFGSEYQKEKYLPKLRDGELVGCFGLTEPDHGSDPGGMKTTAKKDGDYYILNGSKSWITNSPIADVFIIWAKDLDDNNKIKGFVLEKDTDGLTAPYIEGKLSLLASDTGMIMLNDVTTIFYAQICLTQILYIGPRPQGHHVQKRLRPHWPIQLP